MKPIKILIIIFSALFTANIFAADPAPLFMLKSTSSQMIYELDKNIGKLRHDDKIIYDLVDRVLVTHFDLLGMSRAVVGRNYWQESTSNTQQQFVKEFTRYIIRTYSSALQSYDGEKIKFYPIRGAINNHVQINSDLILKNGPPILIQYRLLLQGGKWLIYDFSVNGVSIVKNYNSQFAGTLRQGGLSVLVQKLHKNNASNKY